ncbi:MAG TPA: phosphoribosyltransferase family protein [Acidimicrobiales bacterium]|nr:phosphoribosyltransferase family protein [Acidimicrobiales bacterium]
MFLNRTDAGRQLGARLAAYRTQHPLVVGLPRGGVPVAAAVAKVLGAPLDVIVVRKLGVPYQPELAMGAVGEGGVVVVNEPILAMAGVGREVLDEMTRAEQGVVEQRSLELRRGRPAEPLGGRTVIVVDDGIATGSTARAACEVARAHGAAHVVLAVPVAPPGWDGRLAGAADERVSLSSPDPFYAVGQFYEDFSPTTDDEVVAALVSSMGGGDDGGPHNDGPG